ncbi:MAG TPA: tRNA (adenosine(37)-N6)-dimethylallyltransferase MiaA [Ilumatobacteraceae bacterium]|nr:tRNA (adenosine(37)-N6)-dimethylallyltransferase MiaA [Ilumatobacteraceae bacterium]
MALVGSTASGKSAVAMAVARTLGDVDLVSIDSMQVYRGMDVGTAKPTPAERAEVPHHLLDLVDPSDDFTVADFKAAYELAISAIATAGRRALLVGGTGLHHRVVIDDFDLPGQWPEVRAELDAELDTVALHARLAALDPTAAAKMEPSNRRRVVRALEVTIGSGRPFSSFGPGVDDYPATAVTQIGLRWPREVVAGRIAARVHQMVADGLVAEVAALEAAGGFSRTAAQALGYKETLDALAGRISEDEAIDRIILRTRQFAVRQERWFRRDPRVRWIDIEHDPVAEAAGVVVEAFDT